MYKLLSVFLISALQFGCFSAKGLPIKEVNEISPQEEQQPQIGTVSVENESIRPKILDTIVNNTKAGNQEYKSKVDHSNWDLLLKKYVADNGDVDYKGFKRDSKALNDYVTYLSTQVPTEQWALNEQLAYFINVYNVNTIKLIIDNYPTKSIKDISNPWLKNRIKIGEKNYSLADIENGILRKMNEPRIHFAINCASISCPKLLNTAYTASNVQKMMDTATIEFVNNPIKNKLIKDDVKLSEIFKWYKSDFTEGMGLIEYINQYANIKISPHTKIGYMDYDWNLNDKN